MSAPLFDELFVANLSPDTTEADIKQLFEPYAVVKECWVGQKKALKSATTSFSSVRVESHNEAAAAKKALHGSTFKERTLVVKWASNQRLLWVGGLPDCVTNEALEAGFSQFGSIARARVVADASNSLSRRYGFVLFEDKREAQKALAKCQEGGLLFANSLEPVRVEWARIEDVYEGYSDAIAATKRKTGESAPTITAHLTAPGSQEHVVAMRMKQLQAQYEQTKQQLRAQMAAALGTANGAQGNLSSMPVNQPFMGAPSMVPPPMAPPMQPSVNPLGMGHMAPPPTAGMGVGAQPNPMVGMTKGMAESFNCVPPPSKSLMRMHDRPDRFNPLPPKNPSPAMAPPPVAPAPEPVVGGGLRFVKAGSLSVVETAANAGGASDMHTDMPAAPAQGMDTSATAAGSAATAGAVQTGAAGGAGDGAGSTDMSSTLPGAKPPGVHDHRGIGFTGPAPPSSQGTSNAAAPSGAIAGPRPPPLPANPYGTTAQTVTYPAQNTTALGTVPNYPPPASMGANFSNTPYNIGMQGMGAMQQPQQLQMQGVGMGQQNFGNFTGLGMQSGYGTGAAAAPAVGMGGSMGAGMQQQMGMGMQAYGNAAQASTGMQGAMSGSMQPAMSGYGAPATFNGGFGGMGQQPQMY